MSENFIGFGDTNRTTNNQSGSSAAPTESSVNTETKEKQTKETVETNKSEESMAHPTNPVGRYADANPKTCCQTIHNFPKSSTFAP